MGGGWQRGKEISPWAMRPGLVVAREMRYQDSEVAEMRDDEIRNQHRGCGYQEKGNVEVTLYFCKLDP